MHMGDNEGQLDLPRMKEANFKGGFFAIYVPSQEAAITDSDNICLYLDSISKKNTLFHTNIWFW